MHELALTHTHTFTLAHDTLIPTRSLPTLSEGCDFAATVSDFCVRVRARMCACVPVRSAERCWRSRVRRSYVRPSRPSARDGLWAR